LSKYRMEEKERVVHGDMNHPVGMRRGIEVF
jgi:hypothetical protein